ncbi:MAG: ribonuclease E inhibitor RraB [Terracidiphilus sp.]
MSIFDSWRENALADNDLLHRNDEKGDVFTTPRDVDFAFRTREGVRASDLCDYIKGMNFGNPSVSKGDDGVYWVVNIIHMPITQQLLCSVSAHMVSLGKIYGVEYDGWGSIIQKS